MNDKKSQIEYLLPDYFSNEIDNENRKIVESWRNESIENKKYIDEMSKVWESGAILEQMEQFNSNEALKKINQRLTPEFKLWKKLQKIAAILLLPLLIYSGYLTILHSNISNFKSGKLSRQQVSSGTGMVSELTLPDGTHVWLNSESKLEYPLTFGKIREVNLSGEAFFEVTHYEKHPFIVNTGKINIEVMGTSFNVSNYPTDELTEIALSTGKVKLFKGSYKDQKEIGILAPNQCACYDNLTRKFNIQDVNIEKYLAWKDGILMFVDDPMIEVTQKLSRWFNVNFEIESPELKDYVYRATFKGETLEQVLELLKISAPIDFTIIPRETLANGNYSKKKVIIRKNEI